MSAALVIGKFYPPHAGHLHLLRSALTRRSLVVVLCLGSASDSFSPARRLDALLQDAAAAELDTHRLMGRAGYDEAPFDLADPLVWAAHVEAFRAHLSDCPTVDLLVTSESYGPELAERLGVEHSVCDPGRTEVPGSATALRADPLASWETLGPGTRRMLATRVVLLGAESTGTTTVAGQLAARLRARGGPWTNVALVEEYGRDLTLRKQRADSTATGTIPLSVEWTRADFVDIVAQQTTVEETAAAAGGPVLVCDTDAFATPIWERRYLGAAHARLDATDLGRGDVYLLTHHDGVPFTQDGTRDGAHLRTEMTRQFARALIAHGKPFAVLTGTLDQRVTLAERITEQTMRRKLSFEEPI